MWLFEGLKATSGVIRKYPSAQPIDLGEIVDRDPPLDEPVDIILVPNALIGCYGHITTGLKNIDLIAYPQHRGAIGAKGLLSNYLLKRKVKVDRPAISIVSGWSSGFYHFTLESLMKLFVLRDYIEGSTIVLPADREPFQDEWLRLLGIQDVTYVASRELVHTPLAISSTFPASGQNHHDLVLPLFREWIFEKVGSKENALRPTRIFVGRRTGSQRNLTNQDEMASVLEDRGFEFILMEDHSIAEQIDLFRNAETIVAVHGASLANLAFCTPGTIVVDLIHESYDQQCFLKLSKILGLKYRRVFCTGEPTTEEDARLKDFTAEPETILEQLEELETDSGVSVVASG